MPSVGHGPPAVAIAAPVRGRTGIISARIPAESDGSRSRARSHRRLFMACSERWSGGRLPLSCTDGCSSDCCAAQNVSAHALLHLSPYFQAIATCMRGSFFADGIAAPDRYGYSLQRTKVAGHRSDACAGDNSVPGTLRLETFLEPIGVSP